VNAYEIYEGLQDKEPTEVLLVECFGEDAVVLPAGDSGKKPRLIQYKYSDDGRTIQPSELRGILQGFLRGASRGGIEIDQAVFELVTNRPYSKGSGTWETAKLATGTKLENLIQGRSRSKVPDVGELALIFRNLRYKEATVAALHEELQKAGEGFGMLDEEIRAGVNELVGLLMQRAGSASRRVLPGEVHKAFVGHANPYPLLSPKSVQRRLEKVADFKRWRTNGLAATIPREVSGEIARAVLEHPIVVVVGDGGSGKSVAVSDALTICLQAPSPRFGLVLSALEANGEAVMSAIAGWRNLARHCDGQDYECSVGRLRRACPRDPLLIICIDAIDEKDGKAQLPDDVQSFIVRLMDRALRERQEQEYRYPVTTVVLTCRNEKELGRLSQGFRFERPYCAVTVSGFDDREVEQLIVQPGFDEKVGNRIAAHLELPAWQTSQLPLRSQRPVSPDAMEILRHPVIWQIFSRLNASTQHACLDGVPGLDALGSEYLAWLCGKAERRISSLAHRECSEALLAVSQQFRDNPAKVADMENDWLRPCGKISPVHARLLLDEAMTAGIVVEEQSDARQWRWKQKWFCEYLLREGEKQK
jgi:hypothetical protein